MTPDLTLYALAWFLAGGIFMAILPPLLRWIASVFDTWSAR